MYFSIKLYIIKNKGILKSNSLLQTVRLCHLLLIVTSNMFKVHVLYYLMYCVSHHQNSVQLQNMKVDCLRNKGKLRSSLFKMLALNNNSGIDKAFLHLWYYTALTSILKRTQENQVAQNDQINTFTAWRLSECRQSQRQQYHTLQKRLLKWQHLRQLFSKRHFSGRITTS